MVEHRVTLADLSSPLVPDPVPYAVLVPEGAPGPFPLCLQLHGGGGNRDALVAQKEMLDELVAAGALPPMVHAMASTGEMSWYLDHPDGSARWESFVADAFPAHLRETYPVRDGRENTVITGASMGGYGSLKIAFQRPDAFLAVAAMEPAVEPGFRAEQAGPRNTFFYPPETPAPLAAATRDPAVWAANQPSNRAVANAEAIERSGLAIYLEVGDQDCLHLHDGTEFLHRVLFDLDLPHEYHLVRGADHVGPSMAPRLREVFAWLGERVSAALDPAPAHELTEDERAWMAWMGRGFTGDPPPPLDMMSEGAVTVIREQTAPGLAAAREQDPTALRRNGVLPPSRTGEPD